MTGFSQSGSLLVTNNSSSPCFLIQSASQPSILSLGYVLNSNETVLVHRNNDPCWIRGKTGPIIVQELVSTITPFTSVDLPHDLYTSKAETFRRIRVDSGQTGFFEGREFRTFKELSIPQGQTYTMRIVVGVNTILFDVSLNVDLGACRLTTIAGGTASGTWSETLPVIGKNLMTSRPQPYATSMNSISAGGSVTGGTTIDILRAVTSSDSKKSSSVGDTAESVRGVVPGTYYWKFENLGTSTITGVFSSWWEERQNTIP